MCVGMKVQSRKVLSQPKREEVYGDFWTCRLLNVLIHKHPFGVKLEAFC